MFEQSGLGGMGLTTLAGNLSDRYHDNGGGFWGAGKTVLDLVDPTGPLGVISTGAGDIVKGVLDADPRSVGATAAVVTWSVVIAVATAGGGKGGAAEKSAGKPPGGNGTGKKFTPDFSTKNTKNLSATFKSQGEARSLARTKLGGDPVQVEPGKLRSADGRWQYRGKPEDLRGHGPSDSPHMHLERLNPNTGEVLENWHLRWQ